MTESSELWIPIAYAFGIAVLASAAVMLIAAGLLGFQPNDWPESQARLVGIAVTAAGIVGAIVGLRIAGVGWGQRAS